MTIAGSNAHIVGTGSATLVLPMGTQIFVKHTLLYPDSKCTLLSFKDICSNGFHIETEIGQGTEYLLITKFEGYRKQIVERLPSSPSGLYYTYIKPTEGYVSVYSQACSGILLAVEFVGRDRRLWNSMVQGTQRFRQVQAASCVIPNVMCGCLYCLRY